MKKYSRLDEKILRDMWLIAVYRDDKHYAMLEASTPYDSYDVRQLRKYPMLVEEKLSWLDVVTAEDSTLEEKKKGIVKREREQQDTSTIPE